VLVPELNDGEAHYLCTHIMAFHKLFPQNAACES